MVRDGGHVRCAFIRRRLTGLRAALHRRQRGLHRLHRRYKFGAGQLLHRGIGLATRLRRGGRIEHGLAQVGDDLLLLLAKRLHRIGGAFLELAQGLVHVLLGVGNDLGEILHVLTGLS